MPCRSSAETQKRFFTTWSQHVALIWCCVLSAPWLGQCQKKWGFQNWSAGGRAGLILFSSLPRLKKLLQPHLPFWVLFPRRASSHDLEAEACTALSLTVCSHILLFHCPALDGVVSSCISGLFYTWNSHPKCSYVEPWTERGEQQGDRRGGKKHQQWAQDVQGSTSRSQHCVFVEQVRTGVSSLSSLKCEVFTLARNPSLFVQLKLEPVTNRKDMQPHALPLFLNTEAPQPWQRTLTTFFMSFGALTTCIVQLWIDSF